MVDPKTIEEFMETEKKEKKQPPKDNWVGFVQGDVANFLIHHGLEKITLEDGHGNKAKLSRTKDDGIKVECSSITML